MRAKLPSKAVAALTTVLLAGMASGCPQPTEELEHGVVFLELLRGQSEANNPYEGTTSIEVTVRYLECLIAFYDANPGYTQNGTEGALAFGTLEDGGEGWQDRLCETDNSQQVDCTVVRFRQELDAAKQLTIVYDITGDPENREVPIGPIPTPELAQCEAGGLPIVKLSTMGAVRGLDANGDTIWSAESFPEDQAATGQGAPMKIRATRSTN